jgi:uncharacterized repeat protein (TIGR03837 family)
VNRVQWDIYCRVVDNFGDAGVCARLARQLVAEHGLDVCLWIDRLDVLARLWPGIDVALAQQTVDGVLLCRWQPRDVPRADAAVVIEAFACALGDEAIAAMAARERAPLWLNLEYLSAESWVEGSHGLRSIDTWSGLPKVFFFPGFTQATGGLLREADEESQRRHFVVHEREAFLSALNVPQVAEALYVSLFAYPDAPVADGLEIIAAGDQPTIVLMPDGALRATAEVVCGGALSVGVPFRRGALTLVLLPFLAQHDYDRLLWSCDVNAVRGEDSFVRAQWAGSPLLWQAYRQADAAHEVKLAAFLARYTAGWPAPAADAVTALHGAWNRGALTPAVWQDAMHCRADWRAGAENWRRQQADLPDLASKLVQFYTDWL